MRKQSETLGGRIPLADPAQLSAGQQVLYKMIDQHAVRWAKASGFVARLDDGRLVGPFNIVLESPELGAAFLQLQGSEEAKSSLSERTRQVVILTVGSVWKASYELYAHSAVAHRAGLQSDVVDALARGVPSPSLMEEEKVAQQFTLQLVCERTIPQALFEQAKVVFGVRGIVDMVILAGAYVTVCSLLNTFDVPVPEH